MSSRRSTRRTVILVSAVAAVVVLVAVLVWFQPQKLFLDSRVDEALPSSPQRSGERAGGASSRGSGPEQRIDVRASGRFRPLGHSVSGRAKLLELDDGARYLRLERFMVENGPDLRVYLSEARADSDGAAFGEGFIDLGALKGNVGDQNYLVPGGTDLERFNSAVIWCRRFSVGFAVAPLG